jgi:hypothetical protein
VTATVSFIYSPSSGANHLNIIACSVNVSYQWQESNGRGEPLQVAELMDRGEASP